MLFGIQPLLGKSVLPLLGGSATVWMTCVLFFQSMLLAGYLCAHLLARWSGPRLQLLLPALAALASLLFLPVVLQVPPPDEPVHANAGMWLLGVLAATCGVPVFLLCTIAPLLQRWFSRTSHPHADDPYFLYAASNSGSLLSLALYPFVAEPLLPIALQLRLWDWGYVALCTLLLFCMVLALRSPGHNDQSQPAIAATPSRKQCLLWTALAFAGASWMLACTTIVTTDTSPGPFLWVVPLGLYILTWVLSFARTRIIAPRVVRTLFPQVLLVLQSVSYFRGRGTASPSTGFACFWAAWLCTAAWPTRARTRPV